MAALLDTFPTMVSQYRDSEQELQRLKAQAQAVKEVVAWQLDEAMKKQKISKNKMAALLKTSRTQVDRLLNPKSDIIISTVQCAPP